MAIGDAVVVAASAMFGARGSRIIGGPSQLAHLGRTLRFRHPVAVIVHS